MQYLSAPADRGHLLRGMVYVLSFALVAIAAFQSAQASTNPPKPFFGPPYTSYWSDGFDLTIPEAVQSDWVSYSKNFFVEPYGSLQCTHTFVPYANGRTTGIFGDVLYSGQCHGGNYIRGLLQCPPGYKILVDRCIASAQYEVFLSSSTVHIPLWPLVDKNDHHVLTVDYVALNLRKNGNPVSGMTVPLQSSRGKVDTISGEKGTDDIGNDVADVSTRQQPGPSTITSPSGTIETAEPAVISWLPATYDGKFLVTCYAVANEKHQTGGPMVVIPGLPGKYHEEFYRKTRLQGTGLVTNHKNRPYIHRNDMKQGHPYQYYKCPITASGKCASPKKTIAVDPWVIPMFRHADVYSDVSVSGVGNVFSEDVGDMINWYHIDWYYGPTWGDYESCINKWGRGGGYVHTVTLESYVH